LKARAMVGLEQGVFSSTFDGMVIYVDKMNSLDDLQGIFISDERAGSEPYTIVAKQGRLITNMENLNVTLVMDHGSIHLQPRAEDVYSLMFFDSGQLNIDINRATMRYGGSGRNIDEMDSRELLGALRQARAAGEPTKTLEIELQKRMSISYACLVFGLIGAPLGIRKSRTGRSAGIAISILVILVYYLILGTASRLASSGAVSPVTATWVPNGLITVAAVAMVVKKGNEIYFGIGPRIGALARRAASPFRRGGHTP
ncbi:MAG: YjgP/YjgQ family permease, partial [Nitrospirae bacterium]|nr:YjgP/YjgQ family permease [Nitrospirota bacterium]